MKAKKATVASKSKKTSSDQRSRKMEPLKPKELKNQRFTAGEEESEELDPEVLDENFKGFEESFDSFTDEEDDF